METIMKEFQAKLTADFIRAMATAGDPVELAPRQPGELQRAIYRRLRDGTTILLRTGKNRQLQAYADGSDFESPIHGENFGVDDVAVAMPRNKRRVQEGTDVYLLPAAKAFAALREGHRDAVAGRPTIDSKVRVIYFDAVDPDRPWHGYAEKFAEYKLATAAAPVPVSSGEISVGAVTDAVIYMLAKTFGVPKEAVHISIDLA
jgi:hypothetical protein